MFELVLVIHGEKRDTYLPVTKAPNEEIIYRYIEDHPNIKVADYKIFELVKSHTNG